MKKSKLLLLLKALSKDELIRLTDFVRSPYFNKDDRLVLLYDYLVGLLPEIEVSPLNKQTVFQRVFPKRPFDKADFNHLQNYLLRLVEQFLAHETIKSRKLEREQWLLNTYLERDLAKHYSFKQKQLSQAISQLKYRDDQFHYQQFEFAKTENDRFLLQRLRVAHNAIQEASSGLDLFYLIKKLKFLVEILDRQKKFPQSYSIQEFEQLELLLKNRQYQEEPYIQIYWQLAQMLVHEEKVGYYDQFKIFLDQYATHVHPADLKQLFLFAINYCVRKIGAGHPFQEQLLALYTSGLKNDTLLEGGLLSPWTYKNVIQLGLALGHHQWVEQFMEEFASKLPTHLYRDAYYYNLAAFYYAKNNYEQAMIHLNKVEFSDISYKLWSKELLLKLYFELGELEALHSLLISFEKLIKRNKLIPHPQKEAYRNFIQLTRKLVRKNYKPLALEQEIQAKTNLRERKWLLGKV